MSFSTRIKRSSGLLGLVRPGFIPCLLLLMLLSPLGGCNRSLPTEYGKSKGRSGIQSVNGFGTLRRSFESNDWTTQDIRRLSDRLRSLDAIVWTPTTHVSPRMPDGEAILWLQEWLNIRPRTLIYVVPDEGSEAEYWRLAKDFAPPAQRLEYRRRYAQALTRAMTDRLGDSSSIDRTWFQAKRRKEGSPGWRILTGDEMNDQDPWQYQRLAVAEDGTTLVMRVTWKSPASKHRPGGPEAGESQVLVVAGGSQVNNFALSQPMGRQVAQTLLARSRQSVGEGPRRIGFLLSDINGVSVSQGGDEPPTGGGMELLSVWPLSLVTMHLALMGIVACLILLPIFGRPRRLKERSQSDFADHIHAVAVLMNRSGGEEYARARISDYFRRVRGETTGKWVLPESHTEPPGPHSHSLPHQSVNVQDDTLASESEPTKDEPHT